MVRPPFSSAVHTCNFYYQIRKSATRTKVCRPETGLVILQNELVPVHSKTIFTVSELQNIRQLYSFLKTKIQYKLLEDCEKYALT